MRVGPTAAFLVWLGVLASSAFSQEQTAAIVGVDYAPELFTGQAIDIAETAIFAGFDTEQLIAEQGLVREPRFLLDRFFEPPRGVRLSARLSF